MTFHFLARAWHQRAINVVLPLKVLWIFGYFPAPKPVCSMPFIPLNLMLSNRCPRESKILLFMLPGDRHFDGLRVFQKTSSQ